MNIEQMLADETAPVEVFLQRLLASNSSDNAKLYRAMAHGVLGGGKRLRPFFVLATSAALGGDRQAAIRTAAAIECTHCYSLIHDDLPAMDDDALRRGKPTVHIAFGDATAILAGDALLTLAFEILADEQTHEDPAVRAGLVLALARAAGPAGMIDGQMRDIAAETSTFDLDQTMAMQTLKTGRMIEMSCVSGAIISRAPRPVHDALVRYGARVGLAFQIADDLLDVVGSTEAAGKRTGKDAERGKASAVTLLGIDEARIMAARMVDEAIDALAIIEADTSSLAAVARFAIERRR